MRATMRTMFKETKQKSVRGIKAGAGETRDAKERQNAEQTHKQTKGVSPLSAATEGKKCQSPQNACDSAVRVHVCDPPGSRCGSGEFGVFLRAGLELSTAASAADSSGTKARCVGPDKIRGRAASERASESASRQ